MQHRVRRHLKLVAVVTVVTLALSGFSQARSSGGSGKSRGGGSSSGGGGCGKDTSSGRSSQSRSYVDTDGGSSSGTSGSSSRDREPRVEIVDCLATDGKTVVEMVSRGGTEWYTVHVSFLDDGGAIGTGSERVRLGAGETRRVEIDPNDPGIASRVDDCEITRVV
ncbi:hypothetical protein F0L17_10375 [Streptomyces sp. TRM43335]|uniref:Secreted protein n=1 Tax=Streptomyces taklimakanensis TaxID=2569853 RepID=A0A6G2BBC6_9ACTN|nr:hypothetical protein [Streptomyces taklimakanensis]MTE19524.1 hypothetical protein [Streptomyces taklimakanensis]